MKYVNIKPYADFTIGKVYYAEKSLLLSDLYYVADDTNYFHHLNTETLDEYFTNISEYRNMKIYKLLND